MKKIKKQKKEKKQKKKNGDIDGKALDKLTNNAVLMNNVVVTRWETWEIELM